ncbi:MAG: hypothetical protein LQ344_004855 [Seirophora lacunosa]|nr:MAG: hypothetical protein LQ344_004855 [Seirophora lacunosa]
MLAAALGKMKIGQPSTYGGKFLEKTVARPQYEKFNTHTPPDITTKTRILAVCGIQPKNASPNEDGWFLSDFFAFYHLFRGLTSNQCWMHCLDLEELVTTHGAYFHGSPFKTRKVVLDHATLNAAENLVKVSVPGGMKLKFQQKLRDECRSAARSGDESVLVLLFGHGHHESKGIEIGTQSLKQKEFAATFAGLNVPVTILSTACFSGGWSCNTTFNKRTGEQFNKTTMMAAGASKKSRSWNYTASIGRACGSMFVTAFVQSLTRINDTTRIMNSDGEEEIEHTEEQEETYAEFTRSMYETLLKDIDRRGFEHQITFSAEDDAWDMCWRERIGIPLEAYRERWEALENHEGDLYLHPGDCYNRDLHVTSDQEAEFKSLKAADKGKNVYRGKSGGSSASGGRGEASSVLGKRKTSGMYGGSVQALINQVSCLGGQYLASYPGDDEIADNGALHNHLNRILRGDETRVEVVERCLRNVEYRMQQISFADDYLRLMAIPAPLGQQCHEFNTNRLPDNVGGGRYEEMMMLVYERNLFPSPFEDQGRPFMKGHEYLVAAFHQANLTKQVIVDKLDALARLIKVTFDHERAIHKEKSELEPKRRKVYKVFGINLGNVSPRKRRSRGQSLSQLSDRWTEHD